jgi:phosphoribosylformylglycinamidine synthase
MPNHLGFDINTDDSFRKDAFLFGEAQSRVVVSVSPDKEDEFLNFLTKRTIDFCLLGEVTDETLWVDGNDWGKIVEWKAKYDDAIAGLLAE